mmetsp:Transcript_28731/g.48473  ORF Transcript_28731/g.48473 Transcript_28731/m.48473 type:complete len:239 (-) Transcript_28731:68-784(-)
MNFEKCFEILNDRQNQHDQATGTSTGTSATSSQTISSCPCLSALTTEHSPPITSVVKEESSTEVESYESLDTLELVEQFSKLQEERVMVFREFDSSLQAIIQEGRIAEYSLLCAEVTARFQILSKIIIKVQNVLLSRTGGAVEIGACIKRLQKHEGEKLMVVAAQHMDLIREHYPEFAPHMVGGGGGAAGGDGKAISMAENIAANIEYNAKKRLESERRISDEMENIISEKCELVLDN